MILLQKTVDNMQIPCNKFEIMDFKAFDKIAN